MINLHTYIHDKVIFRYLIIVAWSLIRKREYNESRQAWKLNFPRVHLLVESPAGKLPMILYRLEQSQPDHFMTYRPKTCRSKFLARLAPSSRPTRRDELTPTNPPHPHYLIGPERTFPASSPISPQSLLTNSRTNAGSLEFSLSKKPTMGRDGSKPKVIIFDWDDTICPSSFFDRQQIERMDQLPDRVSARCRLAVVWRGTHDLIRMVQTRNRTKAFLIVYHLSLSLLVVFSITRSSLR